MVAQPPLLSAAAVANEPPEGVCLLALASLPGLGQVGLTALRREFGSLAKWFAADFGLALPALIRHAPRVVVAAAEDFRPRLLEDGERHVSRLANLGTGMVFRGGPGFPRRLDELPDAPEWLFVEGAVDILSRTDAVAVVGTRRASDAGIALARRVAEWLTRRGVLVVSGLAEGIDGAAQQVAVDAGAPTIAVLGHGTDVVFPASTAALRRAIPDAGGAVISEYLPETRYDGKRFVQRNRLQAALSSVVLAVEGDYKSGTAHTVRFGHEQGRLLLGVRANGSTVDVATGIHQLLTELGGEIVDLASSTANEQFAALLTSAMGVEIPTQATRPSAAILTRLIEDFRRLARQNDFSAYDVEQFTQRIWSVWAGVDVMRRP